MPVAVAPGTSVSETMGYRHRRSLPPPPLESLPSGGSGGSVGSGGGSGGGSEEAALSGRTPGGAPTGHLTRNSVSSQRRTSGELIRVLLLVVSC